MKTISSTELQRQLNHPEYDVVLWLMHKIREEGTGKQDAFY